MRQFVPTLSTVASIQKMVTVGMLLCNFPKVTQLENDWVTTQTQVLQNKKVNKIRTDTHIHSMLQKLQNEDHTPLPQTPLSTKLYIYIFIHTYIWWMTRWILYGEGRSTVECEVLKWELAFYLQCSEAVILGIFLILMLFLIYYVNENKIKSIACVIKNIELYKWISHAHITVGFY